MISPFNLRKDSGSDMSEKQQTGSKMSIFKRPKSRIGKPQNSMTALNTTAVSTASSRSPLSPSNGSPNSRNDSVFHATDKLDPIDSKTDMNGLVFRYEENESKSIHSANDAHFGPSGYAQSIGPSHSVNYGERQSSQHDRRKLTKVRSQSPILQHAPIEKPHTVYDVAIIGAGPAGLVLA
jgi:hypothetical protein